MTFDYCFRIESNILFNLQMDIQDNVEQCHNSEGAARRRFRINSDPNPNNFPILFEKGKPPIPQTDGSKARTILTLLEVQNRFDTLSCGIFSPLSSSDWENMVVAGGSILHCLTPGSVASPNSDIDIFLYGLTDSQARQKITHIFHLLNNCNVVKTSGDQITVVRTIHTLTFVCPKGIPLLQFILRLHSDRDEVIASFDVDCCGVLFDGTAIFATARAINAINTRCNIAVPARSSWTYESRLLKYVKRGFTIGVPDLRHSPSEIQLPEQEFNYLSDSITFKDTEQKDIGLDEYLESKCLRKLLVAATAGRKTFSSERRRTKFLLKIGGEYAKTVRDDLGHICDMDWNVFETTLEIAEYIKTLGDDYGPQPPDVPGAWNTYAASSSGPGVFLEGSDRIEFGIGGIPTGTAEVGGAANLSDWENGCYINRASKKRDHTSASSSSASASTSSASASSSSSSFAGDGYILGNISDSSPPAKKMKKKKAAEPPLVIDSDGAIDLVSD